MSYPSSAIWFDLDGTLIDSAVQIVPAAQQSVEKFGFTAQPMEAIRPYISMGTNVILQKAIGFSIDSKTFEEIKKTFHHAYLANLDQPATLFPGIAELLAMLNQSNIAWGIITNKWEKFARPLLQKQLWWNATQTLVCGDTCTEAKPSPQPLLHACQQQKVLAQNCIFIGDSESDILAGNAAGMLTIACRYGYLKPEDNILDWNANFIISCANELYPLLKLDAK